MTSLAYHDCEDGHLMTSDELAEGLRTNPTVVRRAVARLVEAKLLKSYKGKSGGVELARKPQDISLEEIYRAASGQPLLHCSDKAPKKQCAVSCSMASLMKSIIDGVESNSLKYLAGIALADLVAKIEK